MYRRGEILATPPLKMDVSKTSYYFSLKSYPHIPSNSYSFKKADLGIALKAIGLIGKLGSFSNVNFPKKILNPFFETPSAFVYNQVCQSLFKCSKCPHFQKFSENQKLKTNEFSDYEGRKILSFKCSPSSFRNSSRSGPP